MWRMKTKFILVILIGIFAISCQKKEQSEVLPHQTVNFSVGPDFEISMPGALPETIRMISLNGIFQPVGVNDHLALVMKHRGSEDFDTIYLKTECNIENLDSDYFKFADGKNVLRGKILIRHNDLWRDCYSDELTFTGQLSIIYNPE